MDLYAENILDHFRSPRGQEPLPEPSVEHDEINASCGDEVHLQLKIEGDHLLALSWSGTGCAISQAAMSILSEEIVGKSIETLQELKPEAVKALLGVPIGTRRIKCALLSLHTLKNTLRKFSGQGPQSWTVTVGAEN